MGRFDAWIRWLVFVMAMSIVGMPAWARADVLVEPGPDASSQITVDVRDEHIADRFFGSIHVTLELPTQDPNQWYYGWLYRDARGEIGFELRPRHEGPPDAPHRRIVTAVRTDHDGAINPRYRQVGSRVFFDRDYALIEAGSTDGSWIVKGLVPETHASDGSASLIPEDLAPLWYARAGAMRQNGTGPGLAQVELGMTPGDAGACSTTVVGYAHEESTGAVHAQDELLVHHQLSEGTYAVLTGPDSRVDLHATGYELFDGGIRIESLPGSASDQEVVVEIHDTFIEPGHYGSVTTIASLPSPVANRWYYGWLWKDEDGTAGFELRLDDAPAPEHAFKRIVTAVRTGPDATIRPRFRQVGSRVFFDDDITLLDRFREGTSQWVERPLIAHDQQTWGEAVLIPVDLAPLWFSRGQVMRKSGLGPGLGQITLGMLATTAHGAYATQIKGFAQTEDEGAGHGQDEVPVHHALGRGTFSFYLNDTMSVSVFLTGFEIATAHRTIVHRDLEVYDTLHFDLQDVPIAGGQFGSLQGPLTVAGLLPDRWHYAWLWKDGATGEVGVEVRVDDAEPPDKSFRRVVSAFLVDKNGNIISHRLVGSHAWYDGDYEKVLYASSEDGAWIETVYDQLDPHYGSLPFVPAEVSPLWYTRSEVSRKSEHGNGLGEIFFGMVPSDTGSFATSIRGFAQTQPPGAVFVNDELPVHHELGRGTFSYRLGEQTLGSILIAGFELMGALPDGSGVQCPTGVPDDNCDGFDDDCDGLIDEDADCDMGGDTGTSTGDGSGSGSDAETETPDGVSTTGGQRPGQEGCSCRSSREGEVVRWTLLLAVLLIGRRAKPVAHLGLELTRRRRHRAHRRES